MADAETVTYSTRYRTVRVVMLKGTPNPHFSAEDLGKILKLALLCRDIKLVRILKKFLDEADTRLSDEAKAQAAELGIYGFTVKRMRLALGALVTQPTKRKVLDSWRLHQSLNGHTHEVARDLTIHLDKLDPSDAKLVVDLVTRVIGSERTQALALGKIDWGRLDALITGGLAFADEGASGWVPETPQLRVELHGDQPDPVSFKDEVMTIARPPAAA